MALNFIDASGNQKTIVQTINLSTSYTWRRGSSSGTALSSKKLHWRNADGTESTCYLLPTDTQVAASDYYYRNDNAQRIGGTNFNGLHINDGTSNCIPVVISGNLVDRAYTTTETVTKSDTGSIYLDYNISYTKVSSSTYLYYPNTAPWLSFCIAYSSTASGSLTDSSYTPPQNIATGDRQGVLMNVKYMIAGTAMLLYYSRNYPYYYGMRFRSGTYDGKSYTITGITVNYGSGSVRKISDTDYWLYNYNSTSSNFRGITISYKRTWTETQTVTKYRW